MSYPDVEIALMEYLDPLGYTVTSTPADLEEHLPVIRIARFAGGDDWFEDLDFPEVVIVTYSEKDSGVPRSGLQVAEQIRDRMNLLNTDAFFSASANALLVRSQTQSGPVEVGYIDPAVACYSAAYRVTTKGR
jgi:hypothetical protein